MRGGADRPSVGRLPDLSHNQGSRATASLRSRRPVAGQFEILAGLTNRLAPASRRAMLGGKQRGEERDNFSSF